jgi:predicted permease
MNIWRTNPFVAVVAVVALAMGIGFTTTMFSIVHGATRSLPFADAERVVAIQKIATRSTPGGGVTRPIDYRAWRDRARSFAAIGAYESVAVNIAGDGPDPERVTGVAITPNAFEMLGEPPRFGRVLQPQDARTGAPPVVVLSDALWRRRFAGDPAVVGTTIRLTGVPHVIVGVMRPRFGFPVNAGFWTPLRVDDPEPDPLKGARIQAFGRLARGVPVANARAELEVIARGAYTDAGYAADAHVLRVDVVPFQDIETPRDVIRVLYLFVLAVSFVLLIACGNVANLLLARAAVRARDVAVRLALGATRSRLVKEQLAETLSLSAVAMLGGLLIAQAGTRVFAVNTSHIIEAFWVDFRIDAGVLLFASFLAAIATVASGLGPALLATRRNIAEVLQHGRSGSSGRAMGRLSRGMIAIQVTFACGLLALTMVLARTSIAIRSVPWPFDPHSILTFEFELPDSDVDEVASRNQRLTAIARALNETAGISSAALITSLPGRGGGSWTFSLDKPVADVSAETTAVAFVSPEFFTVAQAPARVGRLLTWDDDTGAPRVAVVNESFVRRFSSDLSPIGRRLFVGARDFTIVGVVPDLMARDVQERRTDGVYASILQSRPYGIRVMAKGAADFRSMLTAIRATLGRIDPDMPVTEVFTLHEAVYRDKRVLDVLSTLFLVFGIGALTLTAIGLYGVVSFAVTQRTRELGIRLALGATPWRVLTLVMGQGTRQLVVGLVAGTLLAMALARALAAAVDQLPGADAPLLLAIAAALSVTAFVALIVPAVRAARLEIVQALRTN